MQTADIMIIKTKAVLEAITITAEAILLISIQTGSALMQAVLLVIPAQLVVLPPKIRLLPEIKIKQKQQPLRFLLVGRKMIMAGGTAFPADTYYADGIADIDGATYLFNSDGYMLTGWQQLNGHWYYFNASGAMVTGGLTIDGKYYYFDSDGVLDETDYDAVDEPGDETSDDDTEYDYDYDYDLEEY